MSITSHRREPITLGGYFHYDEKIYFDHPYDEHVIYGAVIYCGYEVVNRKITFPHRADHRENHLAIQIATYALRRAVDRDFEAAITPISPQLVATPLDFPELDVTDTNVESELLSVCKDIISEWDAWDGWTPEGDLKNRLALAIERVKGSGQ